MTISCGLCWNIDSRKIIWPPRAYFGSENESLKGLICCIYRASKTELEQLNEFISNCCQNTRNETVYLPGDFNIDLLQHDTNNITNNFIDHLYSFGLHPLITRPTRITSHSKNLIDNIFTTNL